MSETGTYRVLDLYSGRGGVGLALSEMDDVVHVGVDIEDYSDTYPGEFLRGDASEFVGGGFDLVWASPPCTAYSDLSPTAYGSREAAMDACPTISELRVREIANAAGAEYVIENVPGASREGYLRDAARVNGLAFGLPFNLERHFETSFPCPDALERGTPEIVVDTRNDQSVRDLAEAKRVPASWGKQGVRSAIPRKFVRWVLSFCPTLDVDRPERSQQMLTEARVA
jgi:site-specific DNA-cytosine methylase